jgi:multiple antibiotic resistance protein
MSILSAIFLLFFVIDPLGNVPLYIVALKNVRHERRKRVVIRESLIALAVLVFFLLVGRHFLSLLQLSEPAIGIAGGIILFLIALRMIFASPEGMIPQGSDAEPLVVPLAVPLVAGPATITTLLVLQGREPQRVLEWLLALLVAWLASTAVVVFAASLSRFLGERTLVAMERLMGMLLTAIAVQMFLTETARLFPR